MSVRLYCKAELYRTHTCACVKGFWLRHK